jgi:hypothetical protein
LSVRETLDRLLSGTEFRYAEIAAMVVVADRDKLEPSTPRAPVANELAQQPMALRLRPVAETGGLVPAYQVGEVRGRVEDSRAQPIAGARVSVVGQEIVATTAGDGSFRLGEVQGTEVTLLATAIGYRPLRQPARVGALDIRLTLTELAVNLDEVVVTGTAGAVQKRSIGNAVARIDASEVAVVAPPQDVSQMLNARAPGVVVNQGTGVAGGGNRILIRGISSLSSNGNPTT